MGRSAGFIAAHATMSSSDVDLCLVPEVPIVLEGENGCLPFLMRRVHQQGYAVIVCAEGGACHSKQSQSSAMLKRKISNSSFCQQLEKNFLGNLPRRMRVETRFFQ
jgi:6-phosphofructokinase